jgi:predicted DNA-binding protein (UPF0251 family)
MAMPRPKKPRFVSAYPAIAAFVPHGVPVSGELFLTMEELEAIRLSDFEHLDQESAADLMQVSRQTYGRILGVARSIVGEALVTGKALKIEGGTFEMRGRGRRQRRRFGQARRFANTIKGGEEMPRGDGTGPDGKGPAGRGRKGPCTQNSQTPAPPDPGGGGPGSGSGQGGGQGAGQGRGSRGGKGKGQGKGGGQGGGRNR